MEGGEPLISRFKRFFLIFLMLILILTLFNPAYSEQKPGDPIQKTENIIIRLEKEYGPGIILGDPLEVGEYRIIPVTRIEVREKLQGQGNWISAHNVTEGSIRPMGLVVLSPEGFEFIRIHESLPGQIVERLPLIIQWINGSIFRRGPYDPGAKIPFDEMIASVALLIPEKVFGLGIVSWWVQKLIFASAWYILAFITTLLFSTQSSLIAANMRYRPIASTFAGITGSITIIFFCAVMTASIIGIPISIILVIFYLLGSFLGRVAMGVLLGWLVTGRYRSGNTSSSWILVGGAIMAGMRMIPRFGWIIWLAFGVLGFGGVLVTLMTHKIMDQLSRNGRSETE